MIQYRIELVDLMKQLNLPLRAAEIGVAEGRFSEDLLVRGLETLYMVDVWEHLDQAGDASQDQRWHDKNYRDAKNKVKRFGGKAVFLKGLSTFMANEVPDNSLGMIHLDGDHSYEGVMKDLHSWYPKLVAGGICSGHDFLVENYGVNRAVKEFANFYGKEVFTMSEDNPVDAGFLFIK